MAQNNTGPVPAGYPDAIDEGKTYRVQLLKAVPFAGTKLTPSGPVRMTGKTLSDILAGEHKDSVYGAEEFTAAVPD